MTADQKPRRMDWYFDFISPFTYLQHEILLNHPGRPAFRYRPVVFAGLLDHWGNVGPAEVSPKRAFTYQHCQWIADRNGIPMRFPPAHPFNPVPLLRLVVALDCTVEAVSVIFREIYAEGRDPADAATVERLCKRLGVTDVAAMIGNQAVKDCLWKNGAEAIEKGVFGVPTLVVGERCFWGLDSTEMALQYLEDPSWFETEEYARLSDLPAGKPRTGR